MGSCRVVVFCAAFAHTPPRSGFSSRGTFYVFNDDLLVDDAGARSQAQ